MNAIFLKGPDLDDRLRAESHAYPSPVTLAATGKVLLIGLSGSGKSRCILSLKSAYSSVDMDRMINTAHIYREYEELDAIYNKVLQSNYEIVSVSVVRNLISHLLQKKKSPQWGDLFRAVIYLRTTDPAAHRKRLSMTPAIGSDRRQAHIEAVLASAPALDDLWLEFADHVIDVDTLSETQVLNEVITLIEKTRNKGNWGMPFYLSKADYDEQTSRIGGKHWQGAGPRWAYHRLSIEWAKELGLTSPERVLEMGPMGVTIVNGAKTVDYDASKNNRDWLIEGYRPTYLLDARKTPWPFGDKEFDLIVALRIFHHLVPNQRAAFHEARRTSKALILVVPGKSIHPRGGIDRDQLVAWNDGVPPLKEEHFPGQLGSAYLFRW